MVRGSPPRMRGRACAAGSGVGASGITPAYAGKSGRWRMCTCQCEDHPRVCGEEKDKVRCKTSFPGSPPRMRGREQLYGAGVGGLGITPAYAGKRYPHREVHLLLQDHPRVCGEEIHQHLYSRQRGGSPPRMRGRVADISGLSNGYGITPAYAGKSLPRQFPCQQDRDHPRVCGEELYRSNSLVRKSGSPPRMRGRDVPIPTDEDGSGITPAYAGKRSSVRNQYQTTPDHPRVCGEEYQLVGQILQGDGSPPRMRGRGKASAVKGRDLRITPAYAGKRLADGLAAGGLGDHPRACGEE